MNMPPRNALLDAIKQMKAKRVAIVVGDADELGLPDMVEGVQDEMSESPEDEANEPMDDEDSGSPLDQTEIPGGDEEDDQALPGASQAEAMMGRKPFDKKRPAAAGPGMQGADDEIPDSVGQELYDQKSAEQVESSGKKPRGLFAKANMKLHEKFGRK